jgi:outer membrane autotransporter protein
VRSVAGANSITSATEIYLINPNADMGHATIELTAPVQAGLYEFDIGTGTGKATLRTSGYSAAGQAAVNSAGALSTGWFTQLDNLHSRMGELHAVANVRKPDTSARPLKARTGPGGAFEAPGFNAAAQAEAAPAALSNAFWVRAYTSQLDADLGIAGFSTFKQTQYGADVGYDHTFRASSASTLYLGTTVGYQTSRLRFKDQFGSKGDTESASLGAYATWIHQDGWFTDGFVKGQYFSSDFHSASTKGETENYGLGASLEFGKRINFGDDWFLEPSLQLAYTHLIGESYTLNTGLRIHATDADIFRYIESLRFGKVIDLGAGFGLLQPHVGLSVERQDSTGGALRISDRSFSPDTDGLRGRASAGLVWSPTSRTQLHFSYEYTFGDKYEKPYALSVGFRHQF